ncbi:anthranilate synthase component II [Allosphingosinicella indica]|uniref:Anthranilate synthase, component II n=1 Tax=Allosphingosinicella indica TaxID=941907 RepID=A0A1X7GWJ8_9SPHN|nr:aminodeoxychorismate/anthranilate synthase component II [Allosphingosinicella indica]SMF75831.1 anthranilate synthase, component II [Allosphingosinicella indica]
MILVIDNYDSFTWNLVRYFVELGAEVRVERNDALTAAEALASGAQAFVISPGPGRPEDAGVSPDLVAACVAAARPLLGVCLGHQAIATHWGERIVRTAPVHGKTSAIAHDGSGVFAGLPSSFTVARYHSLAAEGVVAPLLVNATAGSVVMGLRHQHLPIHGVQFHPESVASDQGHALLANFLDIAGVTRSALA